MLRQIAKLIIDQAEQRVKSIESDPTALSDDMTRQVYILIKQIVPVVKEQYGLNPTIYDLIRERGEEGMSAAEIKRLMNMSPKASNDFIYEDIIMRYPDHFGYKKVKNQLIVVAIPDSDDYED